MGRFDGILAQTPIFGVPSMTKKEMWICQYVDGETGEMTPMRIGRKKTV